METNSNSSTIKRPRPGAITVSVSDGGSKGTPITNALVSLYEATQIQDCESFECSGWKAGEEKLAAQPLRTDSDGSVKFKNLLPGNYIVFYGHYPRTEPQCVSVKSGCITDVCIKPVINLSYEKRYLNNDCKVLECHRPRVGDFVEISLNFDGSLKDLAIISVPHDFKQDPLDPFTFTRRITQAGLQKSQFGLGIPPLEFTNGNSTSNNAMVNEEDISDADEARPTPVSGDINVALKRTDTSFTEDTAFWTGIRNSTEALSFNNYLSFMDWIFCGKQKPRELSDFESRRFDKKNAAWKDPLLKNRFLPFTDSDAYRVVKAATEAFVMVNCGVLEEDIQFGDLRAFDKTRDNAYLTRRDLPRPPNDELGNVFSNNYLVNIDGNGKVLPYLAVIRRKLPDIPIKIKPFEDASPEGDADECFGLLQEKLDNPCLLELIWSYWHEEGMLVQSMNSITRRFQNVRSSAQDPLSNLEMDPLRPLNNLLWGYIQDEQHRLTVTRRNYEYDHHYGLRLEGKAVQDFRPADTRSKFLEAFHHLLRLLTVFYKQDDDTTVKADAFPVLNALKEVHLILSQGAHNQFGDLPSTARIEMLMQQWMLARPEFRELLPTRVMVAYPEPWMDRVDAMKKLQGWTDTSVLHFRNLAVFGEQLLLSVRWGHWSDEFEPVKALNWARFFRPQAQGYIHAYRATTGIDLSADPTINARVDATMPSALLKKRLAAQGTPR